MAIVQTVSESLFHDAFHRMGRAKQFSYGARSALFEYYEEMSEDMGEPVELDVIAICCDWSEYTVEEAVEAYPQIAEDVEENPTYEDVLDWLNEQTTAILVTRHDPKTGENSPSFLVQNF